MSPQTELVVREYMVYINTKQWNDGEQGDLHKMSARTIENVIGKKRGETILGSGARFPRRSMGWSLESVLSMGTADLEYGRELAGA